jgi:hypothetical protein
MGKFEVEQGERGSPEGLLFGKSKVRGTRIWKDCLWRFTPVLAKHSKSFSLIDCISVGGDRMQRNFDPMRK